MDHAAWSLLLSVALFLAMVVFLEVGRRVGSVRRNTDGEENLRGITAVEGAVFGLLGLLIAFTFSGAASRFEDRRHLIGQETNAIGTAYLRLDLLPDPAQPPLRALFREYLDLRAHQYRASDGTERASQQQRAASLQARIWALATEACRPPSAPAYAPMLLLPALNEMIDITTTRAVATQNHPPAIVYVLLCGLGLIGALLAGYGMARSPRRRMLHVVAFASIISLTVYVILDLEFPRQGLIRIDDADQVLLDLRENLR
jgi:hypothetical protein